MACLPGRAARLRCSGSGRQQSRASGAEKRGGARDWVRGCRRPCAQRRTGRSCPSCEEEQVGKPHLSASSAACPADPHPFNLNNLRPQSRPHTHTFTRSRTHRGKLKTPRALPAKAGEGRSHLEIAGVECLALFCAHPSPRSLRANERDDNDQTRTDRELALVRLAAKGLKIRKPESKCKRKLTRIFAT